MPSWAAGPLKAADWPSTMRLDCAQAGRASVAPTAATRRMASRRFMGTPTMLAGSGDSAASCAAARSTLDVCLTQARRIRRRLSSATGIRHCADLFRGPLCNSSRMDSTIVRAACPHDCPDTCAMRVTVHDGRAVKVQGDPDHPPTHGALCTKVSRYAERTYHAERVLQPLRRVGPKGSGQFEPVSWDEALSDIAARLLGHRVARARRRAGHRALQLCRHHGPAAGREHGPRASSTSSAPRCWTAPSAPAPAARRWPRPMAARSACTWRTTPRAG